MNDPLRGTGRTTRMLEEALEHHRTTGFERPTDLLLVLATNPRALRGAGPCDVFVDHYVADCLTDTQWAAFAELLLEVRRRPLPEVD